MTQDDDPKVPTMDPVTSYHTQLVILALDNLYQRFSNVTIKEIGGGVIKDKRLPPSAP